MKDFETVNDQLFVAGEERVVVEALVDPEGRGAALQFEDFERAILGEFCFRAAANKEKWDAASLSKLRKMAAESGDAVRLMERVGEECDSWQRI